MKNFAGTMKTLQRAINMRLPKTSQILITRNQVYSEKYQAIIEVISVQQLNFSDEGKAKKATLYKSTSSIQITLFLRDMWYEINGWELPTDDENWNRVREMINSEDI